MSESLCSLCCSCTRWKANCGNPGFTRFIYRQVKILPLKKWVHRELCNWLFFYFPQVVCNYYTWTQILIKMNSKNKRILSQWEHNEQFYMPIWEMVWSKDRDHKWLYVHKEEIRLPRKGLIDKFESIWNRKRQCGFNPHLWKENVKNI